MWNFNWSQTKHLPDLKIPHALKPELQQRFWQQKAGVRLGGPTGSPVPAAHMSRCDGSWDNYLPCGCVCKCKMEQGFPSGSPLAPVSEQLMTFLSDGMKEVTVVCSQLHTTSLLLSTVCLNLPAAFFTPQGDHVIRSPPLLVCHPAAPLLQRGAAGAEKGKQCKQSGGRSISRLLAQSRFCRHSSFRNRWIHVHLFSARLEQDFLKNVLFSPLSVLP